MRCPICCNICKILMIVVVYSYCLCVMSYSCDGTGHRMYLQWKISNLFAVGAIWYVMRLFLLI